MALTVAISGDLDINQGEMTTLTAVVTDAGGNPPQGAVTYHWTAPRGSFVGATDQASVVYHADFTDADDVDVVITCSVGSAAVANPTVSTGSLTAMTALGITGQILNMYITETENTANGSNTILYAEGSSESALEAGSDDDLSDTLNIYRVSWRGSTDGFVLEDNTAGNLGDFFRNNTTQSVYVIFSDGTVYEITQSEFASGGTSWSRWNLTDAGIATKFDNLGADDTLLVGVGDAGSIGLDADTGSNTATVRAAAMMAPPTSLAIASVADQSITVGVDYSLEVSVTDATNAYVTGLLAGFYYDWDSATGTITIQTTAERSTQLLSRAIWRVHATDGTDTITRDINYEVVPSAPIIEEVGRQNIYMGATSEIFVQIQNNATLVDVDGLLAGLTFAPTSRRINNVQEPGVEITGIVPPDITIDQDGTFRISAENGGGQDTYDMPFDVVPGTDVVIFNTSDRKLVRVSGDGSEVWDYTAPNGSSSYDTPIVDKNNDVLLFDESSNTLRKISGSSGALVWTYNAPDGTYRPVIAGGDGNVYLRAAENNRVLKVSGSDGSLAWTSPDSIFARNRDDSVVVGSDGSVFMFRTLDRLSKIGSDGAEDWTFTGTSSTSPYFGLPLSDGSIIVITANGNARTLRKLASSDGSEDWSLSLGSSIFNNVRFPVLGPDGSIYAIYSSLNTIRKVSGAGVSQWTYDLPTSAWEDIAFVSDGLLMLHTSQRRVVKLLNSGSRSWQITSSSSNYRNVVDPNGDVFQVRRAASGTIYKMSGADGSELWSATVQNGDINTIAIASNDGSLIVWGDDDVVKYSGVDGSVIWTYEATGGNNEFMQAIQ